MSEGIMQPNSLSEGQIPESESTNEERNVDATGKKKEIICRWQKDHGITREVLQQLVVKRLSRDDAAKTLNVSTSTLKRACRDFGINRWQIHKGKRPALSLNRKESVKKHKGLALPLPPVEVTTNSTMSVKVTYKNDTIRFPLSSSSTMNWLEEQLEGKFKISLENLCIKYKDEEDEWITLTCDSELMFGVDVLRSSGKNVMRMKVSPTSQNLRSPGLDKQAQPPPNAELSAGNRVGPTGIPGIVQVNQVNIGFGTTSNTEMLSFTDLAKQAQPPPNAGFYGRSLFGCIRTRKKVTCCHFSSDGKFLASAGHENKAVIWNMDTLQTEMTPEEHQYLITDVRFRPNSTQLATASFDKSVRLWDAANVNYCLNAYTGHSSNVMSLDFHPKKTDIFCFCDRNNEVRYWSISPFSCTRVSKQGGSAQVRFQPITGNLLAAASGKVVSIFDVETDQQVHSFQGHSRVVDYICWDLNGELLASVSEDCVKVWSLSTGDAIHEFTAANGNRFCSCVFHPSISALLVIGGNRCLELWNMVENKSWTVPAHENIIAALAQSPLTGMVASASHDSSVKLWK